MRLVCSFANRVRGLFVCAIMCGCVLLAGANVASAANNCTGATYYDADSDTCIACPTEYDDNTDAGKTSVTQCQMQCAAGTYLDRAEAVGYTFLEWIGNTGTAYINTGVTHSSENIVGKMRIETPTAITSNTNIMGTQGNSKKGYSVGWDKGFKVWIDNGGKKITGPNHSLSAGTTHDIEFEFAKNPYKYYIKYDGVTTPGTHSGLVSHNNIHLFQAGNNQSGREYKGRIHYLQIYEDGALVYNFIPARRNSDNALGVYETVNHTFSEATGTLVAGNALVPTCATVGAGQYTTTTLVNYGSTSTPGTISAGYFSTGGATTATPTSNDCIGTNTCGQCTTDSTTGRATYTDSAGGATSCSVCPELTGDLASRIISYDYYPSATHGNGVSGCRVNLSDSDPIATISSGISCAYNLTDNSYGGINSSCQIAGSALSCPAGYPNVAANQPEWDGTYLNFNSVDTMNGRLCEAPGYTVTYDCGAGTGTPPATTTAVSGSAFTPAMNTCVKDGYTFTGWAVSGTNDVKAQGTAFTWEYDADKTFTAQWTEAGFAITTTNLDAGDVIKFTLSAAGSFTVNCGTGGTLGGDGVSGNTITRSGTTSATYTCTYLTGGSKMIVFDGLATGYSTSSNVSAISFYLQSGGTQDKIALVDGKLGVVFPTLGQAAGEQPQFYQTFRGCTGLTSIPATLFVGVSGAGAQMLKETFRECSGLTSLPTTLFSTISGAATELFMDTFNGCTGLTSIPTTLFSNISGAAQSMFQGTFKNCTGLTEISATPFGGVSGAATSMFEATFENCTGLTSLPTGLFGGVSSAASRLFLRTFYGCTGLTSLPNGLFSGASGAASQMFDSTFRSCTGLTSLPNGLFSGVSGAASQMFNNTFFGCSKLTSIPATLFSTVSGAAGNMFSSTFSGCSKLTSIPATLFNGVSGAAGNMFYGTFSGCSKLTSIPATLFSTVSGAASSMFQDTFKGCSNITSIPATLFSGVSGAAGSMFSGTFYGCSKLTSIPATLFSGVSGAANSMFQGTFNGCSNITSIPATLFSGVSGAANSMFQGTFNGCSNITSIPATLFSGVSGAATSMFNGTFNGCKLITAIPTDLFSGVTGAADSIFKNTFNGCTALTGYIPPSTFAGLVAHDHPVDTNMWTDTFKSTALLSSCPSGTTVYQTGYEGNTNGTTWDGKVSCTPSTVVEITLDAGTGNTASVPTSVYLEYGTGWYVDSTGQTSITSLTTLPSKSGYTFGGFYTEPDGAGIRITDENGNFLTNDTALHAAVVPTTAYAHYGTEYTVTYSCGTGTGGTAPAAATTVGGIPFTTAANTCTKSGEVFLGWAISDTNDVKQPGDTFRWGYTENKTLTAQWAPFSVTTRAFASSGTVNFKMSATGTFLVNCGVDGTLSGDGVSGNVITRSSTSSSTYTCTYISGGAKTLSFTGTATGYSTSDKVAAISFYVGGTHGNIAAINGSLGAVFPTLGQNSSQQPQFYQTFYGTGITSIPATLFNGISGAGNGMFRETFSGCSSLTSIPSGLFSGVSGAAPIMFATTFSGCSSLTSIPAGLFDGVYGAANNLFDSTFSGCSSLTSIPSGLFAGVSGAETNMFLRTFKDCSSLASIPADLFSGVTGSANSEFANTFSGCSSLASIPAGLFDGVYGAANNLFDGTFSGCSSLASIPSGLFSGVLGAAQSMLANTFKNCTSLTSIPMGLFAGASGSASSLFNSTFMGCTGITAIPADLFSGVTGTGDSEFKNTFNGCTSLTGYIPPSTFAGLIANGSPTKGGGNPMWTDTFANTALDTVCPSGTTQYTTNYEGNTNGTTWNGRVSCTPTTTVAITLDAGTGNTASVPATVYLDYGTGWYSDSTGQTSITSLTTLPSKSGYIFGGFYTEPNGYGVQVIDENGNFHTDDTILHAAVIATTLYAQFGTTYTVTYSCGAGTGTAPTATTVTGGAKFTTATSTCSREGYAFNGWAVSDTNDVKQSDDTFRWDYTENKTLTAQWAPFGVTTTNLNKGDTIRFTLSATGTFTVNCGAGGWLSGSGVSGNTIIRNDTTSATYTCTYISGGVKTLSFTGTATGYSTTDQVAAIAFYLSSNGGTQAKITTIKGILGAVFPTLGQNAGEQPQFYQTFRASNITSIPATLFNGISGAGNGMFRETFRDCAGITSIPATLFSSISGAADSLFRSTFNSCSSLTSIPATLFNGISGAAMYMFFYTFEKCSSLASIPSTLFSGVSGSAKWMFEGTFKSCTSITSIPEDLFSGVTGSADSEFRETFYGCTSLAGYIPPSTFAGLVANGHPGASGMWTDTFSSTALLTSCPSDKAPFTTGYEGRENGTTWNGKVSCFIPSTATITLNAGTGAVASVPTSVWFKYGMGWYSDSAAQTSIASLTTLPTRTGYTFGGFYTSSDGTGTQVIDANGDFLTTETVLRFTGNSTSVYAKWTPVGYRATYSCGTGSGTAPSAANISYDAQFTVAANTCSKADNVFIGWAVPDTNDVKQPGDVFTWNYAADKTLTAAWAPFVVRTTNLDAGDTIKFTLSATGTFTVDCGDTGTLSGDGVSGHTITRSSTSSATYTCTYASGGVKTLGFDGTATGYSTSTGTAAISFYSQSNGTQAKVASIEGGLGTVFPTLGQGSGQQPQFYQTFSGCTGITSIPETLFSGVSGAGAGMFHSTFENCTGITSIHENLFGGVSGAADSMFQNTFNGCTGITSVPANLFGGVTGAAVSQFQGTFSGCTSLGGYIPPSTFAGLITNNHPGANNMWTGTFTGTALLTACPVDTTQYTTGYEGNTDGTTWNGKVACFVPTPITITLDAGTGTASVPAAAYLVFSDGWYSDSTAQTSIASLTTLPTRAGYTFGGFYTEPNGEGLQVITANGGFVTSHAVLISMDSADSVYAKWTPIEYSVTYNCGTGTTGTPPTATTAVYDAEFTPATHSCAKSGSVFTGWAVSNSNDVKQAGDAFTWNYTENKTLTAQWTAFIVTTTNLSANNTVSFAISASGTFTVDCGANGTLSGDGVSGNTITRNNTTSATYTCTYTTGGVKTIKFDGTATEYSTENSGDFISAAISFESAVGGTPARISAVDGSLGAIFPTLGQNDNQQPRFYATFKGCGSLKSIPATLFTGVTGAAFGMFAHTFMMCTGLPSIPATLFSGITGNATALFYATFAGCRSVAEIPATLFSGITGHASALFFYTFQQCYKVTSIPENLFSGVTGADDSMFFATFRECSGITSIPANLFSGVSGADYEMFDETFNGCSKLTSIPATLFSGVSGAAERMFRDTFGNCTALTSVPATLFSGVSGAESQMFDGTFKGCTSLSSIPTTLFSGVSGAAYSLFRQTFKGCTSLTTIPETLFSGVSGAAEAMFDSAFSGCSGLTAIPENLFSGVRGAEGGMFAETFLGCPNVTAIPANLFSGVSGAAAWMFSGTFAGDKITSIPPTLFRGVSGAAEGMMEGVFRDTAITSIPTGLFSGVSGSAAYLFQNTFRDCESLTSIPSDLFSGITGAAANMFETTFYNCTNLSGYIPPATFEGLIARNHPVADNMWTDTFAGTALDTSCPSGTTQYTTGYEGSTNGTTWNGKVSCVNENTLCPAGEYLPAGGYQCTMCPVNNYCVGGEYAYNTESPGGITACTSGLYAPAGMWESAQCGRILHVGDSVMYLRSSKKTTPSLNFDIDNDGVPDFFGNMTTSDVVMGAGTERKLKLSFGGQTYSVYDDTVTVPAQ